MTLDQLELDQPAQITNVEGSTPVLLRLMEMGLVPGARVQVRKRAPLGGPMELRVRGYLLSIRQTEAKQLSVEPLK